jgi:hypothetical protein
MTPNVVPVLWIVWAIFALVTALLYAYRASLTRDEEGQIFLDEAFAHEKAVQTQIVSKVTKLQPALRASLILTVVMTVVVLAYYAWDAGKSFLG